MTPELSLKSTNNDQVEGDAPNYRLDLYLTGRKHCGHCGCWRGVYEFGCVNRKLSPGVMKSWCNTCERVRARETLGIKARGVPYQQTVGQPYGRSRQTHCKRGHELVGDNVYLSPSDGQRRCKTCHHASQLTPEYREWSRFRADAKRRENGVAQRPPDRPCPVRKGEPLRLPVGPFRDWFKALVEKYGRTAAIAMTGMDDRRASAVMSEQARVHVDLVDRALTAEGGTHLRELYPELYEFEEAA